MKTFLIGIALKLLRSVPWAEFYTIIVQAVRQNWRDAVERLVAYAETQDIDGPDKFALVLKLVTSNEHRAVAREILGDELDDTIDELRLVPAFILNWLIETVVGYLKFAGKIE